MPVIVSSPTGSGKSTRVPLWAAQAGKVLVIEPRRVVARALAQRIAEETQTEPGTLAGWVVRGEAVRNPETKIVFVTPGVALRMMGKGTLGEYQTWILDEFHERRADVDALLAWMRWKGELGRVVLLSATLDTQTLARELGAELLASDGRAFPVDIEHRCELGQTWPQADGLPLRLERCIRSLEHSSGTILVFLPGTGEISECAAWLEGRVGAEIRELHGGLSLADQHDVLHASDGPRVVLATNVAESALTVPDVTVVIDSGLERRIVRSGGFPSLELGPISQASADQRSGRAGRTRAGRSLRLWSASARLESRPKPGIQVDDPDDWLLPLLASGADPWTLPWLDKPRADGLREALDRFRRAGIWIPDPWVPTGGRISDRGVAALELPIPPDLAGMCLALEHTSAFRDALATSCALAQARPLLRGKPSPDRFQARRSLANGSDDLALLSRAVRCDLDQARAIGAHLSVWRDARELWDRLAQTFRLDDERWPRQFQSDSLVQALCKIEPRSLRLRRGAAGREEYAIGDGAGLRPSNSSLVFSEAAPELALAVSTHGGLDAQGRRRVWIEAAVGLSKERALRLDLGRVEVVRSQRREDLVWAQWKLRTGSVVLGQKEGLATDPQVWSQAVVKALDEASISTLQQSLDALGLERCLILGTWIAPCEDASTWLQRNLESAVLLGNALPPQWPSQIPSPPSVRDPIALQNAFPESVEGVGGTWKVRWDVRTGKVRLTSPPGKKGVAPELPFAKGWTVKLG